MKLLVYTTIFVLSVSVFARMGETLEQCKKRYGEPVNSLTEFANEPKGKKGVMSIHGFKHKDHYILIVFLYNKAVQVSYNLILFEGATGKPLALKDVDKLLLLNAPEGKWVSAGNQNDCIYLLSSGDWTGEIVRWFNQELSLEAVFNKSNKGLLIASKVLYDYECGLYNINPDNPKGIKITENTRKNLFVIGHWKTEDGHHIYFAPPSKNNVGVFTFSDQKTSSKTTYEIVGNLSKDGKSVNIQINFISGGHVSMKYTLSEDRKIVTASYSINETPRNNQTKTSKRQNDFLVKSCKYTMQRIDDKTQP